MKDRIASKLGTVIRQVKTMPKVSFRDRSDQLEANKVVSKTVSEAVCKAAMRATSRGDGNMC